MKKIIVILLLLALLAGLLLFIFVGKNETSGDAGPVTSGIAPGVEDTILPRPNTVATGDVPERPSVAGEEEREMAGPWRQYDQTRQPWMEVKSPVDDGQPRPDADQALGQVRASLQRVMDGDSQELDATIDRAQSCRFAITVTQADLENEINFMRLRMEERSQRRGQGQLDPNRIENVLQERRDGMTRQQKYCAYSHSDEFAALRDEYARLAANGNVIARFIYAMMLKPSPQEPDYLVEVARWADNSLRYTTANIAQQQTVGYLAQAYSYAEGIFTPRDSRLAGIWSYILMTCPIEGPVPPQHMDQYLSADRMTYLTPTTQAWGAELVESICPDMGLDGVGLN